MSAPAQPFAAGLRPDAHEPVAQLKVASVVNQLGWLEIQSVPLMAAIARQRGHRVGLFEYRRSPRRAARALAEFAPDIVAYSVCSNEAEDYLAINRALKEALSFFAVFGGPHPTHHPSYVREEGVDAICRGEGDLVFPHLLDHFGSDAMYDAPNFTFKIKGGFRENPLADLLPDLDDLPFPARDLVYAKSPFMARNPIRAFCAGRGCPYNCTYCFNHAYRELYKGKGRMLRTKSVSYLLAEIQDVARGYPLAFVRFYDDVFGVDHSWLAEFAERFPREVGVPFSSYVRPNLVSEEYVRLLKQAGCYSVYTAIECGNERLRTEVLNRRITNEQIINACRLLKAGGVRMFSFNMLGVPGETEEDILDTVRLNRRVGIDFADATIFQPYPGTKAFEYCREHGYLEDDAPRFESFYVNSILKLDPAFKQRIFILHRLFTILVDHPKVEALLGLIPNWRGLNRLITFLCRIYYAYFLHRRIYASKIPMAVRLRGALTLLFSRNRT